MADQSDVLNAIAQTVAAVIYPNGASQPSAVMVSGAAVPAKIYPGWPIPAALDADLKAGLINISIFAPPGMERNTTRYPRDWGVLTPPAVTLTASVDTTGTVITLGGTVSVPQNTAIICNGKAYLYQLQPSDTLASIATALAALVNVATPASASGAVITIPGAKSLVARVGGVGTAQREVRRQERLFQITFWCPPIGPNPSSARDAAVSLVDPILAVTNFLTLADGSSGRLIYVRSTMDDGNEKANCYRRDLFYTVEYGTTQNAPAPEIIVAEGIVQGGPEPFDAFTSNDPPPYTIIA